MRKFVLSIRFGFVDSKKYPDRVKQAQSASGETDALVVQSGTIMLCRLSLPSLNSVLCRFHGLGCRRALCSCCSAAIDNQAAFVCFTASGGARMQEGLFSLMQMAKTTGVIAKLAEHKLPFISVLTDPTMGGVSASFAFMGDVVMAEPKALIGFAGPRVIEQTVREQLPEGFQRSEFLLQKGAIDMIVDRKKLKDGIAKLIALFQKESLDAISSILRTLRRSF